MANAHSDHGHVGHAQHEHHGPTLGIYLSVFAALMVLLVITLIAASWPLGALNLPIAMAIAVAKALLVIIFFMHLGYGSHLTKFFAGATLLWLAILFIFIMGDYVSRHSRHLLPGSGG